MVSSFAWLQFVLIVALAIIIISFITVFVMHFRVIFSVWAEVLWFFFRSLSFQLHGMKKAKNVWWMMEKFLSVSLLEAFAVWFDSTRSRAAIWTEIRSRHELCDLENLFLAPSESIFKSFVSCHVRFPSIKHVGRLVSPQDMQIPSGSIKGFWLNSKISFLRCFD